ncbi:MAG: hypothetical protein R3275_09665 [Saprospiraceae bacterium]|nr:hypothetical protein [Saprospiraceae bacterium]
MKTQDKSRRKWLSWSLWASAGLLTGTAFRGWFRRLTHKKTRFIAADGKVYEVESRRFFKRKMKKVSNEQLKSWMGDRYTI